jgi:DNA repair exonuclease SbcCD ATPase subunit
MTRYFLAMATIEGFRGINNEGDPLEIKFKVDAVNSVFAANGLCKSSLFEALSYAITGTVPKLDRMVAAESAKDYYANRFHTKQRAEIVLTLRPDDGGPDAIVKVVRETNGKRVVTSTNGVAKPEELLAALDDETVLLDHHTFTKFLLDSPLDRGKSFSTLLGLSKLAEVRQGLSTVSDTLSFNNESGLKVLEGEVALSTVAFGNTKAALKQDYFGLVGTQLVEPISPAKVGADTVEALADVPLLKDLCSNQLLTAIDFDTISNTIKKAEKSEEQERLKAAIAAIASLELLSPAAGEQAEQIELRDLCKAKEEALKATKGSSFHDLYAAVKRVFDDGSWLKEAVCPACEATPEEVPYAIAAYQLKQYQLVDDAGIQIRNSWKVATWPSRLQKLEAGLVKPVQTSEIQYAKINNLMTTGQGTQADLDAAISHLATLEAARIDRLQVLNAEKATIQGSLPPSLVSLIEQVERAKRIKSQLTLIVSLIGSLSIANDKLSERKRWKKFIDGACETFENAEAGLSDRLIKGMTTEYKSMYATIAGGAPIIPSLEQKKDSIDLHLRLEKFFTLKNTGATPLLSESYRNAIAISIFLCAALQRKPAARFIILDDVTSSFDAGHQFALMEVLRTRVGVPVNKDGLQVIILSHDGLLEKYFDKLGNSSEWHHQHLQGLPPVGSMMMQAQGAERLRTSAEGFLNAGQTKQAQPLVRQHLEYRLIQIISKVNIPVSLDFAIKDNMKMVGNALEAIKDGVELYKAANRLILDSQQQAALGTMVVPALIANWVSHYETGSGSNLDAYVLLGVLKSCEDFADCFKYDCSCKQPPGKTIRRYYKNLASKGCNCP